MKAILIMMGIMLFLLHFVPLIAYLISKDINCFTVYIAFTIVDIFYGLMVYEQSHKL